MPESHYVIDLNFNQNMSSQKSGVASNPQQTSSKQEETKNRNEARQDGEKGGTKGLTRSVILQAGIVVRQGVKIVNSAVNYHVSTISQRTGQNEYSKRVSETISTTQTVVSDSIMTATSFMINPILGGIILASNVITKGISFAQKLNQQQLAISGEEIATYISIQRKGNMNTRGTS